jgi:hypothetical protein
MSYKYILKMSYNDKYINNQLLPWDTLLNDELYDKSNDKLYDKLYNDYDYQIGIAIKNDSNGVCIVSPFDIHFLYAKCELIIKSINLDLTIGPTNSIKLKLYSYCYFQRLATFVIDDDNINCDIKQQIINTSLDIISSNLSNISKIDHYAHIINDEKIILGKSNVVFKNILNDNIYPFIWIESKIILDSDLGSDLDSDLESDLGSDLDKDQIFDKLVCGTPIFESNESNNFVGIIYNITDDIINIIPVISILKLMSGTNLRNIFFNYDSNSDDNHSDDNHSDDNHSENIYSDDHIVNKYIMINQTYLKSKKILFESSSNLEIGDQIISMNDMPISNTGMIEFDESIKIHVPLQTYIWYKLDHIIYKFKILRNNRIIEVDISSELLINKISVDIKPQTKYLIKNDIIFCFLNLLMVEWLTINEIVFKNISYLEYKINPFFKSKQKCILVGLINPSKHPFQVQKQLKPYLEYIYNIQTYMEFFTILAINKLKTTNIKIPKLINTLIVSDSYEREIILDWI